MWKQKGKRPGAEKPTLRQGLSLVCVRRRPGNPRQGWLKAGTWTLPAALGRGGIRADKREGDGGTPRGRFRAVCLWFRPDRGPRPGGALPKRRIGQADAWIEDPRDRRYNRPVRLAPGESGDRLWRNDRLYDLIVEIDHNARPRVARRGSAVFLHVARPGLAPTAGCIALPAPVLRRLVARLTRRTVIDIQ